MLPCWRGGLWPVAPCLALALALALVLSCLSGSVADHEGCGFGFSNTACNPILQQVAFCPVARFVYRNAGELVRNGSDQADALSFTTQFKFQIRQGEGNGLSVGIGLAFLMAPRSDMPNNSGGMNLGVLSSDTNTSKADPSPHVVAVKLDSFMNEALHDASHSHNIGVDVNSLVSIEVIDNTSPTDNPLNFHRNYTFLARIVYFAANSSLKIRLANLELHHELPSLQAYLDHPPSTVFLPCPSTLSVGLSASSGIPAKGVSLYSWSFSVENPAHMHQRPLSRLEAAFKIIAFVLGLISCCSVYLYLKGAIVTDTLKKLKQCWQILRSPPCKPAAVQLGETREAGLPGRAILTAYARGLELPYDEVVKAVKNFHPGNKLGEGGFGEVYKGTLPRQMGDVAVKRPFATRNTCDNARRFALELDTICTIPEHPNLLKLLGWSYEAADRALLVYRYLQRGDLGKYVHGETTERIADPNVRMRIVVGVAKGLLHLHEQGVVHRDVKPANVLLTEDIEAVLCDFGLLRPLRSVCGCTLSTAPMGSPGFLAPEIAEEESRRPTEKADVYSFGVLTLVIACGRKALVWDGSIIDWVRRKQVQQNDILQALDPVLYTITENRISTEQQWQTVLTLGLRCTARDPDSRPSMRQVVDTLTSIRTPQTDGWFWTPSHTADSLSSIPTPQSDGLFWAPSHAHKQCSAPYASVV